MIKVLAAAAVMSLSLGSATGAGAFPSAAGLNDPAASGIVQVKGRGGGHAGGELAPAATVAVVTP